MTWDAREGEQEREGALSVPAVNRDLDRHNFFLQPKVVVLNMWKFGNIEMAADCHVVFTCKHMTRVQEAMGIGSLQQ